MDVIEILSNVFGSIFIFLTLGIIFSITLWIIYCGKEVLSLRRRIASLKARFSSRECLMEKQINYVKSIMMFFMLSAELLCYSSIAGIFVYSSLTKSVDAKIQNCSFQQQYVVDVYHYPTFRILFCSVLFWGEMFIFLSIILTGYFTKTYQSRRYVPFNKLQLTFIGTILIAGLTFIPAIHWKVFIILFPCIFIVITLFQLFIYAKSFRALYRQLLIIKLDAWYDGPKEYRKLGEMCKTYFRGSILYIIFLTTTTLFGLLYITSSTLELILSNDCVLEVILQVKIYQIARVDNEKLSTFFNIFFIANSIVALFLLLLMLFVHLQVFYKLIYEHKIKKNDLFKKYCTPETLNEQLLGGK